MTDPDGPPGPTPGSRLAGGVARSLIPSYEVPKEALEELGINLRATPSLGPMLVWSDWANHVVLFCDAEPRPLDPRWHWRISTPEGRWEVGWVLVRGVRLTPWERSGEDPSQRALAFLRDACAHLAKIYGARELTSYRNPTHPSHDVEVAVDAHPVSLADLTDARAHGGRSRSTAKIAAAHESIAAS